MMHAVGWRLAGGQYIANNRNSWSALELARYLIEYRHDSPAPNNPFHDPDWSTHTEYLLEYAMDNFGTRQPIGNNTWTMGEQDEDHSGWGGANSKLGGVSGMYGCALAELADAARRAGDIDRADDLRRRSESWYQISRNNLSWLSYYIDTDGASSDHAWYVNRSVKRGGWVEDAHTDVVHNFIDALNAYRGVC